MRILPLTGGHDRQGFDCGQPSLNDWLCQVARQHQDKWLSNTFVAILDDVPERIYGYYALTVTEVDRQTLPKAYHKKLPRHIPGIRLGRLAVDLRYQGRRLGELLLIDAIARVQRVHQEAGVVGLFVDVLDDRATGFYRHFGFMAAPDNSLMLFLPVV